jgi:hypothetical protein
MRGGTYYTHTDYSVYSYHLGLDVGQASDPSALSIVREEWAAKRAEPGIRGYWQEWPFLPHEVKYDIVHLERFPLNTSYPDIVELVANRVKVLRTNTEGHGSMHKKHRPAIKLAVDYTGVGRGVVDFFRLMRLNVMPITLTGGAKITYDEKDGDWHVPKRELVTIVQLYLQGGQVKVAPRLPEAEVLSQEMTNFRYSLNRRGNELYGVEWREGKHDDLLLATACALFSAYLAEQHRSGHIKGANATKALRRANKL